MIFLLSIGKPSGTRRGATFGAAGVHPNWGYGGVNPHHHFLNRAIFMRNPHLFSFASVAIMIVAPSLPKEGEAAQGEPPP
jgi:hypothetical protein